MKKICPACALALALVEIITALPGRAQSLTVAGTFTIPSYGGGIAIDSSGDVTVLNFNTPTISHYSPGGTLLNTYTLSGVGGGASTYAAGYGADILLSGSGKIDIVNPSTSSVISTITDANGTFGVTSGNNEIFASNFGNSISVYTPGGTLVTSFSAPLGGLAYGPGGDLYETNGPGQVSVYSTSGTHLSTITVGAAGANYFNGIVGDGNDLIAVSQSQGTVYVLSTTGTVISSYSGLNGPTGVAVGPNGQIYVTDLYGNTAYIFNALSFATTFGQTPGLTPNQRSVGTSIDGYTGTGGFSTLVTALSGLPTYQIAGALDQLSPVKFGQFTSTTAFNNAVFQTEALDNYLDGQRTGPGGTFIGGNGDIDASGLSINDSSYDPALAMVHSRLLAWNPGPAGGLISDVGAPMFGGADMKDVKNMSSTSPENYNPWNVFVQGNVVLAQGFSDATVPHFSDNTESVTLGADYRFSPHFLVGLTAGYAHTDANLDDFGSTATVDSYSPGIYASYADSGWYANASGNYVYNTYSQTRQIDFLGQSAKSGTGGNQGTASLDGGYDFHTGALTYGPLAGVEYTHLEVDGYNESGSVADLSVSDSNSDSLRSRLGGRISYSLVHCGVTFTPHLDASWQHEFLDQARGISGQFIGSGLGSFAVRTATPDRDSALIDAGLNADINRSVTVFGDYEVQAGQSDYFGQSVQAGVKIGF